VDNGCKLSWDDVDCGVGVPGWFPHVNGAALVEPIVNGERWGALVCLRTCAKGLLVPLFRKCCNALGGPDAADGGGFHRGRVAAEADGGVGLGGRLSKERSCGFIWVVCDSMVLVYSCTNENSGRRCCGNVRVVLGSGRSSFFFIYKNEMLEDINLCFGSCFVGVLVGVQKLKRREGIKDCNEMCKTVKKGRPEQWVLGFAKSSNKNVG